MGLPPKSWNNTDKTAHSDLLPIRLKCNNRKFLLDISCCYQWPGELSVLWELGTLASVRSSDSKQNIGLWRSMHRVMRDCCVPVFTEIWFNNNILQTGIEFDWLTLHRGDRVAAFSGKHPETGLCGVHKWLVVSERHNNQHFRLSKSGIYDCDMPTVPLATGEAAIILLWSATGNPHKLILSRCWWWYKRSCTRFTSIWNKTQTDLVCNKHQEYI